MKKVEPKQLSLSIAPLRLKIIASVILAIVLVAVVVVIAFPQVAATRYGYFDANNVIGVNPK